MKRILLALALLFSLPASQAFAWNSRGHMMVAAVAWDLLDENTRERVVALLKLNPDYESWIEDRNDADKDKIAFVMGATWPDVIKHTTGYINDGEDLAHAQNPNQNIGYADMIQHRYWHYVDKPFSKDGTALIQPQPPNAKTQIEKFRDSIRSNASDDVKSYDLVWLLHLVGDIHQPLHATSRFSASSPKGDRGGNDVALCDPPCRSELHAFWDAAAGNGNNPVPAIKAAARLDEAPDDAVAITEVQTWVDEGFDLAVKWVYRSPIGNDNGPFTLTDAYKKKAKSLARDQVALAGARLAKLITENLK